MFKTSLAEPDVAVQRVNFTNALQGLILTAVVLVNRAEQITGFVGATSLIPGLDASSLVLPCSIDRLPGEFQLLARTALQTGKGTGQKVLEDHQPPRVLFIQ